MEEKHMFSNKDLFKLLLPLIVEQLLNSLMGTADTIMVSNVGSEAISAVSLVDSICVLVIQVFSALAAGGVIVCSQYIGRKDEKSANRAAAQVVFTVTAISLTLTVMCLLLRRPLLRLIFGSVEPGVMSAAQTYFFYMALSFPFIALFSGHRKIPERRWLFRRFPTELILLETHSLSGDFIWEWQVRRWLHWVRECSARL